MNLEKTLSPQSDINPQSHISPQSDISTSDYNTDNKQHTEKFMSGTLMSGTIKKFMDVKTVIEVLKDHTPFWKRSHREEKTACTLLSVM